jgi:hypothetical protein
VGDVFVVPFLGYIKITVTTSEFPDVRFSIYTGTYDVLILLPIAGTQPAGAAHVPISILVHDQGLEEFENPFLVFIKEIPLGLLNLSEHFK